MEFCHVKEEKRIQGMFPILLMPGRDGVAQPKEPARLNLPPRLLWQKSRIALRKDSEFSGYPLFLRSAIRR
jgi:hypothetical protein